MIGKILVALAAVGIALAPPAMADDVESYLEILHGRGITADNGDGTLVQVGQEICDLIETGRSPMSVAAQVYRETDNSISSGDAGFIVGAAIGGLCPEYTGLIRQ